MNNAIQNENVVKEAQKIANDEKNIEKKNKNKSRNVSDNSKIKKHTSDHKDNKNDEKKEEKQFNIEQELEYWKHIEFNEGIEKDTIERFIKIRTEKINKEYAKVIMDSIFKVIPYYNLPSYLLKLYFEIPKKDSPLTSIVKQRIETYSKEVLENFGFDTTEIDSIGKIICSSKSKEDVVTTFINNAMVKMKHTEFQEKEILSLIYYWLVSQCKHSSYDYVNNCKIIEKCFVSLFRDDKDENCINKSVPSYIVNGRYKKGFLNISYLYRDLENDYANAKSDLENVKASYVSLLESYNSLYEKDKGQSIQISELNETINNLNSQIQKLDEELIAKTNMLEYEKNKYAEQYNSKADNLMNELNSIIGLELDGIANVAERLPEKEGNRIRRYLSRINERVTELGGDN